jgi:hypothetical protein
MEAWKKCDLIGRSIILFAIFFQLTVLGALQDMRQRDDVAFIMNNQAWVGVMVERLAGSGDGNVIANTVSEAYKEITPFSERKKSNINNYIFWSNIIFGCLFLFGSSLSVISRYLEHTVNLGASNQMKHPDKEVK